MQERQVNKVYKIYFHGYILQENLTLIFDFMNRKKELYNKTAKTTDFGFEEVVWEEKQQKVNKVFDSVANRYDIMNDLMSFGLHRWWKKITVQKAKLKTGQYVLDIAGGTGDLSSRLIKEVGAKGIVILSDINSSMINIGREKLTDLGYFDNIGYIQADAECLPFSDNVFDCIVISFGLRNMTNKMAALASVYRILKPGGRLVILEFSRPNFSNVLNKIYDEYSFKMLPFLGKMIAHDEASYRYLAESIRKHPDQEQLKLMMSDAGFDKIDYQNITFGIVAIHTGIKY